MNVMLVIRSSPWRRRVVAFVILLLATPLSLTAQSPVGDEFTPLPAPTVRIGAEGDPEYEFGSVGEVVRLPGGRFAVSDWGRPDIRVFNDQGKLVQTIGRKGAGPGEFRSIVNLFLSGDTLIAYDWQLRRLTWLSPTGEVLRTAIVQPASSGGPVSLTGRFTNGRWLVTTPSQPNWDHGPGPYRDTLGVGTLPATASGAIRWLGSFPGATIFAHMPGQDKSRWIVGLLPRAASTAATAMGDSVLVGDNSQATLEVLNPTGTVVRRITLPLPPGGDPRHLREAARREALAEARDARSREYTEAAFAAPWQDPRYESFLVADDATIWVRLLRDGTSAPNRYLVLTPAGKVLAGVRTGSRSRIRSIRSNEIVVVTSDSNDVEQIEIIRRKSTR